MKEALIIVNQRRDPLVEKQMMERDIYLIHTNLFGCIDAISEYSDGKIFNIEPCEGYSGPDENGNGFESWFVHALKEKAYDDILVIETNTNVKEFLNDNGITAHD